MPKLIFSAFNSFPLLKLVKKEKLFLQIRRKFITFNRIFRFFAIFNAYNYFKTYKFGLNKNQKSQIQNKIFYFYSITHRSIGTVVFMSSAIILFAFILKKFAKNKIQWNYCTFSFRKSWSNWGSNSSKFK